MHVNVERLHNRKKTYSIYSSIATYWAISAYKTAADVD